MIYVETHSVSNVRLWFSRPRVHLYHPASQILDHNSKTWASPTLQKVEVDDRCAKRHLYDTILIDLSTLKRPHILRIYQKVVSHHTAECPASLSITNRMPHLTPYAMHQPQLPIHIYSPPLTMYLATAPSVSPRPLPTGPARKSLYSPHCHFPVLGPQQTYPQS